MLSNITIGQYYPAKSLLHRMDPRMKVILTAVFIVLIFLANNFASMALVLAFLGITVALSRVPLKMILRGLKAIVIIVVFTSVLNLFYVQGGKTLVDFWIVHITTKGVYTALFMAIRIMALIISSSLLTYTTTPTNLTDGLERLLSPLRYLRVPVHDIAMMMTIALRFIPTLIDEVGRIMNAQKARRCRIWKRATFFSGQKRWCRFLFHCLSPPSAGRMISPLQWIAAATAAGKAAPG